MGLGRDFMNDNAYEIHHGAEPSEIFSRKLFPNKQTKKNNTMSAIISISLKLEDIKAIAKADLIEGKKGTYLPLSINVNDTNDAYGQNVSVTLQQSKEDREAKKPRTFLGNGRVVWEKDGIKTSKSLEGSSSDGGDDW